MKVTLLGDNVIKAEVNIKHAKMPGGVFRSNAQPDVQWKLQQLQVCRMYSVSVCMDINLFESILHSFIFICIRQVGKLCATLVETISPKTNEGSGGMYTVHVI